MLNFSPAWRFGAQPDEMALNGETVAEFYDLIGRIPTGGKRYSTLEHFKKYLAGPAGIPYNSSSSVGWAESDLQSTLHAAARNGPLFVEGFFDGCESLRESGQAAPEAEHINAVLERHGSRLRVRPPDLVIVDGADALVPMPRQDPTNVERVADVLHRSVQRSSQLLDEGHGREAVQELLWLLETVSTGFRGVETASGRIEGTYFNRIVRELRGRANRPAIEQALVWMNTMHGFLSSPGGGGVRHGLDLNRGVEIDQVEARLFCNLIRSYLGFLLAECERMGERATQG